MEIVVAPMSASRPQQQHVEYPRIVVKVGTNVLTAGSDELNTEAMAALVKQIVELQRRGIELVVVTSGAIAVGRYRVTSSKRLGKLHPRDVQARQVAAYEQAVGDFAQSSPPASRVEFVCWIHFVSFLVFTFVVGDAAPEREWGNAC